MIFGRFFCKLKYQPNMKFTLEEKIKQNILRMMTKKDFAKDIKLLRSGWNPPIEIQDNRYKSHYESRVSRSMAEFLHEDILELRKEYKLSDAYHYPLCLFVVYNNMDKELEDKFYYSFPPLLFIYKDEHEDEIIGLKIYPETTITDVQRQWQRIKQERKNLLGYNPEKQTKRKNLERDFRIYQLKQRGLKGKEIVKIINEKFPYQQISYQDISKIIKRLGLEATKKT